MTAQSYFAGVAAICGTIAFSAGNIIGGFIWVAVLMYIVYKK